MRRKYGLEALEPKNENGDSTSELGKQGHFGVIFVPGRQQHAVGEFGFFRIHGQQQLERLAAGSCNTCAHRKKQRASQNCMCIFHASYWRNQHASFQKLICGTLWARDISSPPRVFAFTAFLGKTPSSTQTHVIKAVFNTDLPFSHHTQWRLFRLLVAGLSPVFVCFLT